MIMNQRNTYRWRTLLLALTLTAATAGCSSVSTQAPAYTDLAPGTYKVTSAEYEPADDDYELMLDRLGEYDIPFEALYIVMDPERKELLLEVSKDRRQTLYLPGPRHLQREALPTAAKQEQSSVKSQVKAPEKQVEKPVEKASNVTTGTKPAEKTPEKATSGNVPKSDTSSASKSDTSSQTKNQQGQPSGTQPKGTPSNTSSSGSTSP
ncbi:hypothetical protein [Paenibacillus sp. YYML68]|uniref:hypothetical protein n=1 Tax=Paenibacillus sp. YYML68 TaxID=2909250 RepID=UPI00248F9B5B|nr:hypothetical protein [Paenibacillus sp. YYML68]